MTFSVLLGACTALAGSCSESERKDQYYGTDAALGYGGPEGGPITSTTTDAAATDDALNTDAATADASSDVGPADASSQ